MAFESIIGLLTLGLGILALAPLAEEAIKQQEKRKVRVKIPVKTKK